MITRIVKMTFEEGNEPLFLGVFEEIKAKISTFPGCLSLELLQDKNNPCIFFTYSVWENESSLENYRTSEFFAHTWKRTKALFSEKAEAWTTESLFKK